jgi:hypothetical protein
MKKGRVNRLIGIGILIFVLGFFAGQFINAFLLWLIPIGSIMTFIGVFLYFKTTNLRDEFSFKQNDDLLTYFWNVIILKLWTFIFMLWMIPVNFTFLTQGTL